MRFRGLIAAGLVTVVFFVSCVSTTRGPEPSGEWTGDNTETSAQAAPQLAEEADTAAESRKELDDLLGSAMERAEQYAENDRPFMAAKSYLDAARTAAKSGVPENSGLIADLLYKARKEVESILIQPVTVGASTLQGKPFESFKARVSAKDRAGGLEGVDLTVSYQKNEGFEEGTQRTRALSTLTGGEVLIAPPSADMQGSGTVILSLNLEQDLDFFPLGEEEADAAYFAFTTALERTRAVFPYRIRPRTGRIPLGILIIDRDSSGNRIGRGYTASGLSGTLPEERIEVVSLNRHGPELIDGTPREVAERVAELTKNGSALEQLIYGNARITGFTENNGRISISVSGAARAVSLPMGEVLYFSGEVTKTAIANKLESAVASAYRQLGRTIGLELIKVLQ